MPKNKQETVHYLDLISHVDKLPIYTDIETLDLYCSYLLSSNNNKSINYANLMNLKEYVDSMDDKVFQSNDSKMARHQFIRYYLEAKLDKGLTSHKLALRYAMNHVEPRLKKTVQREILDNHDEPLEKKDIQFINNSIFAKLNVNFLHKYKPGIARMIEDLDSDELYEDEKLDDCIELIQSLLSEMTKAKRRSKQENRFNLSDPELFNSVMNEACDRLLSDAQFLTSGFQGLDLLLNGGFENARIYNFIGATGGFKSGLLLNLMKTIKKNNRNRPHKDPNKRPTILFISQENNLWETIERIFSIFGRPARIRDFEASKIMEILREGGFCVSDDKLDIDIEFRYYGNADIGVPDLKGIYEELDNQGREVICIIQDYIERLKPPVLQAERRIQLFDISNQLHDLAQELDIPIITGSQFNKNGVATIEAMQVNGKADIGKNVGTNDISESFGMLKNFDVNIGIVIEYDSMEERYYLSFRKLKLRGADGQIDYFLQPFVEKRSKIQLMEDGNAEHPVYRISLRDEIPAQMQRTSENIDKSVRQRGTLDLELNESSEEAFENQNILSELEKMAEDEVRSEAAQNEEKKEIDRTKYECTELDNKYRDEDGFIDLKYTKGSLSKEAVLRRASLMSLGARVE